MSIRKSSPSQQNRGPMQQTGLYPVADWMEWMGVTDRKYFMRKLKELGVRTSVSFDLLCAEEFLAAIRKENEERND